jgi:undecaprenyl-diphosphatase
MHLTYLQAVVIGLIQGITELFPISSLGHVVLVPAWLGGSWGALVREESSSESPYLAFVVGLHLATAAVLVAYYWREWARLIRGLVTSIARRRIRSADERLAWLIVVATIPVGIVGLVLEHTFRVLFAKPAAAAIFLTINGGILILGERYWRRERARAAALAAPAAAVPAAGARLPPAARPAPVPAAAPAGPAAPPELAAAEAAVSEPAAGPETHAARDPAAAARAVDPDAQRRLAGIGLVSALCIGASQVLALLAGISREGVTMVGGLSRGLSHEDAMRFSFLLSTPVILAAGLLKLPDLAGPLGNGIRGPVVAGSVAAAAASALAVVFLARYFRTRTLTPFAIYCLAAGLISIIRFTVW